MEESKLLRELADREAIRAVLFKYCRFCDRLDLPLGYSIFHDDSFADYGDYHRGPGREVIDKIYASHQKFINHSHQISNILISIDGDQAGSEAYVTVTLRMEREGKLMQIFLRARYCDVWKKREGRWAIVRRVVATDHDEIREVTSVSAPYQSMRDTSDPSYAVLKDL